MIEAIAASAQLGMMIGLGFFTLVLIVGFSIHRWRKARREATLGAQIARKLREGNFRRVKL